MQDLTPAICKSITGTNPTGQLVDSRDDKVYWVTKLKDNNCWMVQNLDYDGGGAKRIELSAWSGTNKDGYYNIAEYYDPGLKVLSGTSLVDAGSSDTHLLIGNYYSWQAANSNICPSGWQLPTSNNTSSGSFGGLLSGLSTSSDSALLVAPYYFVRGGNVVSGGLYSAGNGGYYWSSTAYSSINAYRLSFGSSGVYPSSNDARYIGQSVRCLVQGS